MTKFLLGFILIFIFSCSSEEAPSASTNNQNSGISNRLDSANKEISKLVESATEKDELIDRITQELSSTNKAIDILSNSLEELKLQYSDLNNKNLNLSEEIEKLLDEKLLLEMSIKNLRTQYEATTIEKSVEGNKSKNMNHSD
jgi:chromosome segregation ATPase